ncbi:MAG: GIY-YIG nuclease family protein [Alphaproteobacteria bacterium]|nr:GIY-YIG nuclease family protein [Alphaproteobacteria bacterium]
MNKSFCVYIMASQKNGTLYIGVTSNLPKRVWQHKTGTYQGFTHQYSVANLVYYRACTRALEAISLEKRMKKMLRSDKIILIEKANPEWDDLAKDWYGVC